MGSKMIPRRATATTPGLEKPYMISLSLMMPAKCTMRPNMNIAGMKLIKPAGTTIMKTPMREMVRIPPSRSGGSVRLPTAAWTKNGLFVVDVVDEDRMGMRIINKMMVRDAPPQRLATKRGDLVLLKSIYVYFEQKRERNIIVGLINEKKIKERPKEKRK